MVETACAEVEDETRSHEDTEAYAGRWLVVKELGRCPERGYFVALTLVLAMGRPPAEAEMAMVPGAVARRMATQLPR